MWTWDISAGELSRDGQFVSKGYSGKARGKNNPALVAAVALGPIPPGRWSIVARYDSANVGPAALKLEPTPGTETFGRSAFRIHGDSIRDPGNASHGCIILPRPVRDRIWASGDRELLIVA